MSPSTSRVTTTGIRPFGTDDADVLLDDVSIELFLGADVDTELVVSAVWFIVVDLSDADGGGIVDSFFGTVAPNRMKDTSAAPA
ncbi:hypothetical protein GCM10025857_03290 [Alicyclobacillus contaminans]|uniref:hypothetical protein n=1 Tax=Alicyclobacillus contaminans TaxID=392016 RepID=UPI00146F9B30|nr:hypothetical protein [Alicyclobacillus contaminans]GMA48972.1 hypothetical protein GCM10025857_03290 [Alicyclobacillus contaminans]